MNRREVTTNHDQDIWDRVAAEQIIAVVIADDPLHAVQAVSALQDGGVNAIELALRTPEAMASIEHIRRSAPKVLLGVGTVLTPTQVRQCCDAGADFAVSPGVNRRVISAAIEAMLPFAPGIATPSDIEAAVELGCRRLKFFPAEQSGGLGYLRSIAAPYHHLGLSYIPLGGISQRNCRPYFESPLISAVGGSWLAPPKLIRKQAWKEIRLRAQTVCRTRNLCRESIQCQPSM